MSDRRLRVVQWTTGKVATQANHTPKPMKLKCEFRGSVDGTHITGKVKAGFMGSYPFTAVRM